MVGGGGVFEARPVEGCRWVVVGVEVAVFGIFGRGRYLGGLCWFGDGCLGRGWRFVGASIFRCVRGFESLVG